MYADLHHLATADLNLADEFYADRSARRRQVNLVEQFAADEAVVAIDVADANPEEKARAEVVDVADPDAMRGVMSLEFVAVDQTGGCGHALQQSRQFGYVVLTIAIGVEHDLF